MQEISARPAFAVGARAGGGIDAARAARLPSLVMAPLAPGMIARAAPAPWLPARVTLARAVLYFELFGAAARTLAD